MDSRRSRNCENLLTVKSKMADVRLTELQFFNRHNSAEDCSTSLEFGTEFDYMTDAILQTYKVKLWKVKVTAWRTEIHHPSYFPDLAPSDYHMLSIQRSILLETDFSPMMQLRNRQSALIVHLTGFENLQDRYRMCTDKGGDYVEK